MKNILGEKPKDILRGRLLASVNFVNDSDLKDKEVLDIGCGFGWCELNFLNRGVKKITGIEITEDDLKNIKQNLTDERLALDVGSAINLPFANESFDTVVSWEVIEHIPERAENKMFAEVYRVLKPGGYFYLSTPNNSFFTKILDPAWWFVKHRHYSAQDLMKYSKEAGFETSEIKTVGGWWSLISILDLYISKWIFRRPKFFKIFLDEKEDREYAVAGFTNLFIKCKKI